MNQGGQMDPSGIRSDIREVLALVDEVVRQRPGWWPFEIKWGPYLPGYQISFCKDGGRNWANMVPPYTLADVLRCIDQAESLGKAK